MFLVEKRANRVEACRHRSNQTPDLVSAHKTASEKVFLFLFVFVFVLCLFVVRCARKNSCYIRLGRPFIPGPLHNLRLSFSLKRWE